MSIKTIAGPFTEYQAMETAKQLGRQYSVFSVERKDTEGYGTGVSDYWVEQDDSITSDKILGYDAKQFMAGQYK